MLNKHKFNVSFMTMMRKLVRETGPRIVWLKRRKDLIRSSQELPLPKSWSILKIYVQGVQPRVVLDDNLRNVYIVIKTKELNEIIGLYVLLKK